MKDLRSSLDSIRPLNASFLKLAEDRLASQTRPRGSLGFLEDSVKRIVAIQEKERPSLANKWVYVFASDHGLTEEDVSLYPREVTAQMVSNFIAGGATINVLARSVGARVEVIDIGVDHDFSPSPTLYIRKVRYGTRNIRKGPAMSSRELDQALAVGLEMAVRAKGEGADVAAAGDMGIGNTTASSAVIAALAKKPAREVTGRGTGIDEKTWRRKVELIETALEVNAPFLNRPEGALQALGGFEIAGIAGFIIGCASEGLPVVIDGLVSSAAALAAGMMHPGVADYMFFGHRSFERGQDAVLETFGARALLDLDMRLGEGTGACLAMGILEAGIKVFNEVATFEEARISGEKMPAGERA
jgi:nicotinate-nucleotide--dimethylbenzimidazole phosphoribosyltransferase